MTAPAVNVSLIALAKNDPVESGDLLAIWNEHSSRWRTCRVWKVVNHRFREGHNTAPPRTIHVTRDIDAQPEYGTGTSYTHWDNEAGYHQINHTQNYHLVERGDDGRAWVDAQKAIEAQDEIDEQNRREADRISSPMVAARMVAAAMELERLARSARADAARMDEQAAALYADAALVRGKF